MKSSFKLLLVAIILVLVVKPSFCQSEIVVDRYWEEAERLKKEGKYLEAAQMYEKSEKVEESSEKSRLGSLALKLSHAGSCYRKAGNYTKAIENEKGTLEFIETTGNQGLIASILYKTGEDYQALKQYNNADDFFKQSLEVWKKIQNKEKIADCINMIRINYQIINQTYRNTGRYKEAIESLIKSVEFEKNLGNDEKQVAKNLMIIGTIYDTLSQYEEAINYYCQSMEIMKRQDDMRPGVALCLMNIGITYSSWGKYDKAIDFLNQALIASIEYRTVNVSKILKEIGNVHLSLHQQDEGTKYLNQAKLYDKQKLDSLEVQFGGIGISFSCIPLPGLAVVDAVLQDLPAYKMGVQLGDTIIALDGQTIIGMKKDDILSKMRGEIGNNITLTLKRSDMEGTIDKVLIREKISVKYKVFYPEIQKALQEYKRSHPRSIK
jgi:tetratricopeptide (TPR) repeat protein